MVHSGLDRQIEKICHPLAGLLLHDSVYIFFGHPLRPLDSQVIMHSLTFFFANFGPNATTFLVTAYIFPARLRSACHCISAASGELGDIIGAFGFLYLAHNPDKAKSYAGHPTGSFLTY
ncbi:hypothetical protein SADUNF_Sadunf05G0167500 [Salix dunnii]|uniref:Uncharacterized protein n=1 Tax=Salix dunnii TaxID=1413687 RepID=A0A835K948_9ROSI|nr:hypothetical protein SADUNF_Sadunf05G0167500 [Salix dunnii]